MTQVILLNGPPQCGKDTLGSMVRELASAQVAKFAYFLKYATHGLYGFLQRNKSIPAMDGFEKSKDKPHEFFLGLTPRQAYINVSETYMKRHHGEAIFGELLLQDIRGVARVVVTDSGFAEEAQILVDAFGKDQIHLVQLSRPGCSFEADSRGFIELPGVYTSPINNNGTFEDLMIAARLLVKWSNEDLKWDWPIYEYNLKGWRQRYGKTLKD